MEFFLLLAISLAFAARSGVRLIVRRFPHPADLASLSTFYYGVPLAAAAYASYNYHGLVFLSPEAADPGLALTSMRYVVIAMICLELGCYLGRLLGEPRLLFYANITGATQFRTAIWFPALFAMLGIGIFLFGWNEFRSGYASEVSGLLPTIGNGLIFSATELLGLVIMVTLILGQRFGRVPLKVLIIAALGVLIFVLAFRAKRLEVVTALMPAALVLFSSRSWISTPWARMTLGGCALLGLVLVSTFRVSDQVSLENLGFYTMTEGVYAGHSLPGIENRLEAGYIGYEYGARFLFSVVSFVPRIFWESKDELLKAGNDALDGVSPLGATNFLAETVLQGGVIAVVLVFTALGLLCQRSTNFERIWDKAIANGFLPLRFGLYVVVTAILIPHFRDGIVPSVKLALQALLFLILIVGIHFVGRIKSRHRPKVAPAL